MLFNVLKYRFNIYYILNIFTYTKYKNIYRKDRKEKTEINRFSNNKLLKIAI